VSPSEKARLVLDRLRERIPRPETELEYRDPFQLLVAVVLSAQCTDERVNRVTPALFERFPTPQAMAEAEPDEILAYIRSVSYPNQKAKALAATARMLVDEYGGEVPRTHAELMRLKGVGRKTANVVASVAFDEPAIAVDTHVFRVANRIGLVNDAATPAAVEEGLTRAIPKADWTEAHHLLILHGRYTCTARAPQCDACPLTAPAEGTEQPLCDYYAALLELPPPLEGLDPRQGRYYAPSSGRYFDAPGTAVDRHGVEQLADPATGSIDVYDARTGRTTRKVKDYRIG
jgi:endonuclease-3